jgi:hypothetical protein
MELEDKILFGRVLIAVLDEQTAKLDDPFDDELPQFIKRAMMVKFKMKNFYFSHNQPPEMDEQIERMDGIIKRLMDLQNKKCY